jgi:hypothetical protein
MSPPFDDPPDPFDDLLAAPRAARDVEVLRQKVLAETNRVLRRRRRVRQFARAAGLAACVALALFGARWLIAPAPPVPSAVAERPSPPESRPTLADPDLSPVALEWRAFDSPGRQAELFRQAGDRYLAAGEDLQAALRCYGNALDAGSEDDQKPAASDSWLLMAIKDARQKENRDVPNGM